MTVAAENKCLFPHWGASVCADRLVTDVAVMSVMSDRNVGHCVKATDVIPFAA